MTQLDCCHGSLARDLLYKMWFHCLPQSGWDHHRRRGSLSIVGIDCQYFEPQHALRAAVHGTCHIHCDPRSVLQLLYCTAFSTGLEPPQHRLVFCELDSAAMLTCFLSQIRIAIDHCSSVNLHGPMHHIASTAPLSNAFHRSSIRRINTSRHCSLKTKHRHERSNACFAA